jgi:nucleotide-binding universal stress UspA family protein
MRILVPLDGTPLAERALRPAVELLNRLKEPGELAVVRVMAMNAAPTLSGYGGDADMSAYIAATETACEDYLSAITERLMFKGLMARTVVAHGIPEEAICATARDIGADLIMLTSHGRAGVAKLALGSVAEVVARDAHIPTLIVRPEGDTFPDVGRFTPLTILVPLDGSPLAETALSTAIMFARAFHGTLRLARILEPGATDSNRAAYEAFAYLTKIHNQLEAHGVTTHRTVEFGEPAATLATLAHRYHADLIAIATHGRHWFGRLVNGSVAEDLAREVALPIVIVHPAATELAESSYAAALGPMISPVEN